MNKQVESQKSKVTRGVFTFAFCLLPFALCFAQEVVTPLTCNPVLVRHYNELVTAKKFHLYSIASDTLSLPFLDDFSKESIYPDTALWLDKDAFINRDLPIAPPTLGVATLDGVGPSGMPYDTLASTNSSAPADKLTSKPIHLKYLPSDSVYFSFFWQAQGRGNFPEKSDSLLLQFKNPSIPYDSIAWTTVWSHAGYSTSPNDTTFHLVMLRVDTAFLKDGFQFRFRNWATISGNVDHWHIDYVFLDKNRNRGDTIFSDVAFVYNPISLLKNYTAMPWEQYDSLEMKSNLNFVIRNNDTTTKLIASFKYNIFNNAGGTVASYDGGVGNILPFIPFGYGNIPTITTPCIGTNTPTPSPCTPYSYPKLTDTASFLLECALNTTPDKDRWNDTLRYRQKFYDYYAYDDGTAEGGYGVWVSPGIPGGEIAYKFTLNHPDTIVAVQIMFNWMVYNQHLHRFRIMLWKNDGPGGMPRTVILKDSLVTPQYQYTFHPSGWGNLTNDFYTYMLTSPEILSGTFYVGLVELYTPLDHYDLLNIGLDYNTNANSSKLCWSLDGSLGSWNQSQIAGSLMMRPVFRNTAALASVSNNENILQQFNIFPNPTTGKFTVVAGNSQYKMEIYNMMGEKVYSSIANTPTTIDLSDNYNGIYFLRLTDEKGTTQSQKLILAK